VHLRRDRLRWKVHPMSPDLTKYRRIAADHGEAEHYDEAALLRLYSVLEDLVPRIATEHCPHLFPTDGATYGAKPPLLAVDSHRQEASP
ncbi:MAG: hypothetical protein AAF692_13680, partial [Pseudomonadota bacterium]